VIASLSWEQWILGFALTLPRFLAALSLLPLFARQALPGLLRTGVAVSLCLLLVPFVASEAAKEHIDGVRLFILVLKEVIIGVFLGYAVATVFWAVDSIGYYIDNQRGSAMASSADPLTGADTTILGTLFTQAFTVYFLASGTFLALLGMLYGTYKIWPVTNFIPSLGAAGPVFYLNLFDRMLHLVVLLSAPLIITMFLTEFSLALVSRFAPQLNVFFLAMPIKSAVAMLLLLFYVPILFSDLIGYGGGPEGIWRTVRGVLE
jgi:type III secretion protein T